MDTLYVLVVHTKKILILNLNVSLNLHNSKGSSSNALHVDAVQTQFPHAHTLKSNANCLYMYRNQKQNGLCTVGGAPSEQNSSDGTSEHNYQMQICFVQFSKQNRLWSTKWWSSEQNSSDGKCEDNYQMLQSTLTSAPSSYLLSSREHSAINHALIQVGPG